MDSIIIAQTDAILFVIVCLLVVVIALCIALIVSILAIYRKITSVVFSQKRCTNSLQILQNMISVGAVPENKGNSKPQLDVKKKDTLEVVYEDPKHCNVSSEGVQVTSNVSYAYLK